MAQHMHAVCVGQGDFDLVAAAEAGWRVSGRQFSADDDIS
jgi:hypothetical protein